MIAVLLLLTLCSIQLPTHTDDRRHFITALILTIIVVTILHHIVWIPKRVLLIVTAVILIPKQGLLLILHTIISLDHLLDYQSKLINTYTLEWLVG